jgi:hypothetical protein
MVRTRTIAPLGASPETSDEFQIYSSPGDIRFLSKAVQPPSQIYVDVNDDIAVSCASSQVNERITVSYRLLRFDGELVLGQFQVAPASDRSVTTYLEGLAEGFLLSVSCRAAVATTRGQTFLRVFLTNPVLGNGQPSYVLFSDYVTTQMSPAHPNGRVLAPSEGPGNIVQVFSPNPAAGADWVLIVPTNARWRIISANAGLTVANAGAARKIGVSVSFGGVSVWKAWGNQTAAINSLVAFSIAPVTPGGTLDATIIDAPIPPDVRLLAASQVQSQTVIINAADQWGAAGFLVEEWLDNV